MTSMTVNRYRKQLWSLLKISIMQFLTLHDIDGIRDLSAEKKEIISLTLSAVFYQDVSFCMTHIQHRWWWLWWDDGWEVPRWYSSSIRVAYLVDDNFLSDSMMLEITEFGFLRDVRILLTPKRAGGWCFFTYCLFHVPTEQNVWESWESSLNNECLYCKYPIYEMIVIYLSMIFLNW